MALLALLPLMRYGQTVTPHPVSEEFASDYYTVLVNGLKVPISHTDLNVNFASFDFTGKADLSTESKSSE